MRAAQAQSVQRHEVAARLTADAGGTRGIAEDAMRQGQVRWTDKDGKERTGTALVNPGTPKGTTVRIWVDQEGTISSPPMTAAATTTGWLVGGTTAVAVATGVIAARTGMRLVLDRRRYAQWDAEWDLVEPGWSARFHQ
ncbi:hypothetical protein [Streptomyces sp. NBRC 110611]|uniref:Rv1733c family protein n=1 Tax=Streptomyces sp. NBRC 110611 TaxID=1621259 RepID=UPI00285290D8|nr:hypothetical protein [Streptomyces sp. NBRC 110611]